jgi:hypothetical protein
MTREERAAKYTRDMKPHVDKQLELDRGDLVRRHREKPSRWPELDTKWDRWYRPDEWTDEGKYVGPPPCIKPVNPDPDVINTPDAKAIKLAAARAALAGIENKLGVKPADATKLPPADATKLDATKLGRPAIGETPMTATERSRLRRERLAKGEPS